jgi:hypothetical protein
MAHFAQLDDDNFVLQVIVVNNSDCLDENGNESEAVGVAFCKSLLGDATRWKQTSYNGNMRFNYAGIGYQYDAIRNAFIPVKPYPSWVLNETTCQWNAPVAYPTDKKIYAWDEATLSWVEIAYPSPYPSWIKNETTGRWEAPIPLPNDGKKYSWDEPTTSWVEVI